MTTLDVLVQTKHADTHVQERADLAASFRWFARLGMHEAVANHLSVAVSEDGARFLVNPRGRHFATIRASDLLLLDAHDTTTLDLPDAPDPTAWHLHSRLHALLPAARCIMHLHQQIRDRTRLPGRSEHAGDRHEHGAFLRPYRHR